MIIPRFRIEDSLKGYEARDDKINRSLSSLRAIRAKEVLASVSGQPLHVYNTEQYHFRECEMQLDTMVRIGRIVLNPVLDNKHRHEPKRLVIPEPYPIMQCFDNEDNEILMGMLPILNFEISLITEVY